MPRLKSSNEQALIRRYLIWCFKTTKETLDRTDRKFTQVLVDRFIFDDLNYAASTSIKDKNFLKQLTELKNYIDQKECEGIAQKYASENSQVLHSQYLFTLKRFEAICRAIKYFLGPRELTKINRLYEEEMTRRILESKDH